MAGTISFLRRYGWVLLVVVAALGGGVIAALLLRRRPDVAVGEVTQILRTELAGAKAEGNVERRIAVIGRDAALAEVNRAYDTKKEELAAHERAEAQTAMDDPVALAGLLARAGARQS